MCLWRKEPIFAELTEGAAATASHREGKLTLRTYKVAAAPLPKVDTTLIRDTRKRPYCSRAVFACRLRINERILENGNKAVRSRILRRRRPSFFLCADIPIL
jgi:putative transcriptional regulator